MSHPTDDLANAPGGDLDPDVRRFIQAIASAAAAHPELHSVPYPQARRLAAAFRAPWAQGGPAMLDTWNVQAPTCRGPVRLRIHKPVDGVLPALVYLHGGGWTLFDLDTHDRLMREYAARAGCSVVGVDYALSPEAKYPVALEQVIDVVRWLGEQGHRFGIEAGRLAVGGDSAGANLSVAACLSLRRQAAASPVRAMVLNYGAFTAECSPAACRRYGGADYMLSCEEMAQFWRNYLRDAADARDPLACPLRARLDGLPPAFLAIAECDILAEQNLAMAERLREAGVAQRSVVYPGASHSFLEAVSIAAVSERALAETSAWLAATL